MVRISIAVATYNEEENISRCLESVRDFAWEIVAVDGKSTDRTVEILKKFGARVEVTENPDNFHINKNKAIRKCRGDWILQLDADEAVTHELKQEILNVTKLQTANSKSKNINGFWIPRKNLFMGRFLTKGGQYPDYTLRLYRRGLGILPEKSVHEQAVVKGEVGFLENPLLHYSYPDFAHYLKHFALYTDLFAKELDTEKKSINPISVIDYMLIKPLFWFLSTYIRHKGFYDGFPGFVFSLFSAFRFPVSFFKYFRIKAYVGR